MQLRVKAFNGILYVKGITKTNQDSNSFFSSTVWSELNHPNKISSTIAPTGGKDHKSAISYRGQGPWRVVLQIVPPSGTGQCGCRGSWVRRDCLESSPLSSFSPAASNSGKAPGVRLIGWRDQASASFSSMRCQAFLYELMSHEY